MEPRWEGDTGQLGIPVAKSPSGGRAEWREQPTLKISLIIPAGALTLSQGQGETRCCRQNWVTPYAPSSCSVTSERGLPATPRERHLPPPQTSDQVRGTRSGGEVLTSSQALGHVFTAELGQVMERWETALNRASFLKQTSSLQKMGISKINEADYCQLLKGI